MSPKKLYSFMIEPEMAQALKAAKARDPEKSEGAIIREALREWLAKQPSPRRPKKTR